MCNKYSVTGKQFVTGCLLHSMASNGIDSTIHNSTTQQWELSALKKKMAPYGGRISHVARRCYRRWAPNGAGSLLALRSSLSLSLSALALRSALVQSQHLCTRFLRLTSYIQIRPYGALRPHALPLLRFTPEATDKSPLRGSGVELGNVVIG